jgi:hypothetical protein
MILSEHKSAYLDALESADSGDYQQFVNFMLARGLDTVEIVQESVRSEGVLSIEESISSIEGLFSTKSGYTQENVEEAGRKVYDAFLEELKRQIANIRVSSIQPQLAFSSRPNRVLDPTHREPVSGPQTHTISLSLYTPALPNIQVTRSFTLWLPTNASSGEDIQLRLENGADIFSARMEETFPLLSETLRIRMSVFSERIFGEMLADLKGLAEQALRSSQ